MTAPSAELGSQPAPSAWVIVEPNGSGHRFWYVHLLLSHLTAAGELGRATVVTTQAATKLVEWDMFLGPYLGRGLRVVAVDGSTDDCLRAARSTEAFVVFPDGDRLLAAATWLALRGRRGSSLLLMRPFRSPGLRGAITYVAKRALIALAAVAAPTVRVLRLSATPRDSRRGWVSDPTVFAPRAVDRDEWLAAAGLSPGRRTLVVLGDVGERKHAAEFIDIFRSPAAPVGWQLALVGRPDAVARHALAGLTVDEAVTLIEGFVTDEDFDTWVSVADAVAVVHRNEGASGILGKCAAGDTPVLIGGAASLRSAAGHLSIPAARLDHVTAPKVTAALATLPPRSPVPPTLTEDPSSTVFARALLGLR